ncbi:helix-turn-helix transcriptional regulator [Roseomonas hellenica]|uniref:Helix-turn-helix transcriptional regulator n=1 Tax=Plastoroseomonas hellenica TaxID=2687306 RepID=A0ABS5F3E9_9PROT|nr:helix-turn-helix transcriptional regulator [Plastoroseomonas hellenica]MBR0667085.1 helix-turn-helix transcriptional regulator [Plastoroseomonas hellenica]
MLRASDERIPCRCAQEGDALTKAAPDHGAAVDAIYSAVAAPGGWPETLRMLADHIGATGAFLIHSGSAGCPPFIVQERLRADLVAPYFRDYSDNPYARAFARVRPGQVYIANQLVDVASLRRSAFYADILVPQAMEDQVVLPHASLTRNGSSGGISFALSKRQLEGRQSAVARLRRLAPHLSRAIDLSLHTERSHAATWQTALMLDAMPGAALLLDSKGCILRANSGAEALLHEGDGIFARRADGLVLAAHGRTEARRLSAAIAGALAVARGDSGDAGEPLVVTRPSGRSALLVLVTPLPPTAFSIWDAADAGARVLVQIADPHAPAQAQAEALRRAVGLTAAEARVAALVGAGNSVPEAAKVLGISPLTAKTHLLRCFDKAGVRSQVALARLLASLPLMPREQS